MRKVTFEATANRELDDAYDWYEGESPGLGERFLGEVAAMLARIQTSPAQFAVVQKKVRKAVLQSFPYSLLFEVKPDDSIRIIACFHGKRDPMRWQRRV